MFRSASKVALLEIIIYVSFVMWAMMRPGNATGVWIPLVPFFWLLLAFRLWIGLRIADAFAPVGDDLRFYAVLLLISLICGAFWWSIAGNNGSWMIHLFNIPAFLLSGVLARKRRDA